jgi:hypothetical protein
LSIKTVKHKRSHSAKIIRLISGRNSIDYSLGIPNPHENVAKTDADVLSIWNEKINVAKNIFEPL